MFQRDIQSRSLGRSSMLRDSASSRKLSVERSRQPVARLTPAGAAQANRGCCPYCNGKIAPGDPDVVRTDDEFAHNDCHQKWLREQQLSCA